MMLVLVGLMSKLHSCKHNTGYGSSIRDTLVNTTLGMVHPSGTPL